VFFETKQTRKLRNKG